MDTPRALEGRRGLPARWKWRPSLPYAVGLAASLPLAIANAALFAERSRIQFKVNDFRYYYAGARIGLDHGWTHLYDLVLQQRTELAIVPGSLIYPFLSPPPAAWVALPFTLLPPDGAYLLWLLLLAGLWALAGHLAAPPAAIAKLAYIAAGFAFLPAAVGIMFGQIGMLVAVLVVIAWRLLASGRETLAGVALIGLALKPQLGILLPLVLLLTGHRRAFAVSAAGIGLLGAASVLILGPAGVSGYLHLLAEAQQTFGNRNITFQRLLGPGPAAVGAEIACAGLALLTAWRLRDRAVGLPLAAGILGSVLCGSYVNVTDLSVLLIAAALVLSAPAPRALKLLCLAAVCAASVTARWPEAGLLSLLAVLLGLAYVARGPRPALSQAAA